MLVSSVTSAGYEAYEECESRGRTTVPLPKTLQNSKVAFMLALLFWTSCCLELETCQTHLPRLEDCREHFEVLGGQGLVTFLSGRGAWTLFPARSKLGKGLPAKGRRLGHCHYRTRIGVLKLLACDCQSSAQPIFNNPGPTFWAVKA